MTTAKTKRWVLVDTPVERLLDEIGVPDLDYYSAGEERALKDALAAWPLLATVAHTLRTERPRAEPTKELDQPLRVVVDSTKPTRARDSEETDDAASCHEEAG
jgi:hypothetical protein